VYLDLIENQRVKEFEWLTGVQHLIYNAFLLAGIVYGKAFGIRPIAGGVYGGGINLEYPISKFFKCSPAVDFSDEYRHI
jgi:hypothetical protein